MKQPVQSPPFVTGASICALGFQFHDLRLDKSRHPVGSCGLVHDVTPSIIANSRCASARSRLDSTDQAPFFHRPCASPFGAPGDMPPCILQTRFPFTAADRHDLPNRVRA